MDKILVICAMTVVLACSLVSAQVGPAHLIRGQALYEQHCLACHGKAGDGRGPDAQYLIVPPANFTSPSLRAKTDADLLMAISNGVLFSPMHAWRDRLSEENVRDLISYLRMLSPFNAIS